jgi:Zn-dependent protease
MTGENAPLDQQTTQAPPEPAPDASSPDQEPILEGQIEPEAPPVSEALKPPAPPVFHDPPDTFYQVNYSKGTIKEFTWSHSPVLIPITGIIGLVIKTFGLKLTSSTDDPPIHAWAPYEVADIPEDSRSMFLPVGADLAREGFINPVFHHLLDPLHDTIYTTATLQHPSGRAMARVFERKWFMQAKPKHYFQTQFITEFVDGTWLITDNAKPDTITPGTVDIKHIPGLGISPLWAKHQERLGQAGKPIKANTSPDDARRAIDALHTQLRDFHLARGFFFPLDEHEKDHLRLAWHSHQAMSADPFYTRCIYAQANRNTLIKKQSWAKVLFTLLFTCVLFAASFKFSDNPWPFIAMLIGVLFIHESGHYIAMRAFGYKNVKMFFIPFFGAAVTGRAEKVASWKQVISYLAGPVPGILLAVPIAIAGHVMQSLPLLDFALLLLILNGFNLFPILPFDGGHVVHKSLFVRHPVIEAIFRICAALCLLLLGILISIAGGGKGSHLTTGLAIWMAFSIPLAIKNAWFVYNTRESLPLEEPDTPLPIGPTVGRAIINHLTSANTNPMQAAAQNKAQTAALTTPIVENLRTQPPHIAASIAFVFAQFGAIGFAVIMIMLVVWAQQNIKNPSGFSLFPSSAGSGLNAPAPSNLLPPANVLNNPLQVSVKPGYAPDPKGKDHLIAASFPNETAAKTAYDLLDINTPEKSGRLLAANTVVASIPPTDQATLKAVVALVKQQTEFTLDCTGETGLSYTFKIQAPSQGEAAALATSLNDFFSLTASYGKLIPPWQSNDPRTPEQKAAHDLARKTYRRIEQEFESKLASDPELLKLQQQVSSRNATQSLKESTSVYTQILERRAQLRSAAANQVKAEPGVDTALPDLYLADWIEVTAPIQQVKAYPQGFQRMSRTLKRMGTMQELAGSGPAASARYATVETINNTVSITISFDDPIQGPPAFIKWLESQNFTLVSVGIENNLDDYFD